MTCTMGRLMMVSARGADASEHPAMIDPVDPAFRVNGDGNEVRLMSFVVTLTVGSTTGGPTAATGIDGIVT